MIRGSSSTVMNGTLFIIKLIQPFPPKYALRISRSSVSEPGKEYKEFRFYFHQIEIDTSIICSGLAKPEYKLTNITLMELFNVSGCDWFEKFTP